MSTLVKNKKIILITGILLIPIVVPILTSIIEFIFNSGVEIGTKIRYIMEGFSC